MRALLLKDYYAIRPTLLIVIPTVLLFGLQPNILMMSYAVTYMAILPVTAFSYDERAHWNRMERMLPYSVKDAVLSRYVLGVVGMAAAVAVIFLGSLVEGCFIFHNYHLQTVGTNLLAGLTMGTAFLSLSLPLLFKFGTEKARILYIALIMVFFAGAAVYSAAVTDKNFAVLMMPSWWELLLVIAVMLAVSVPLSMKAYRSRK